AENNHVKVALLGVGLGLEDKNTWYVHTADVEIEGNEPDNTPNDEEEPPTPTGPSIKIPGQDSPVYLSEPIVLGGHFTWAEATKNGARIPANKEVVDGIIKIAGVMEEVRTFMGDRSIKINSWYRDPATNRRVGGASKSRHLSGDAVDFVVDGIGTFDVYKKLEPWWGDKGGLASSSRFTHIDARGYKARWSYGY
ncbi:MAG: DUF882 domain-containing protein, partial [Cyanothece sp. SIO1E1]|nr:DUF882 domain-containing protein [Cyanothece sp. SIO1E1]